MNNPKSAICHLPFEIVYSYTRAQAVADGVQVEVTQTAQEAGIRFPVFLTRTVYDAFVTVPPGGWQRRPDRRTPVPAGW
jgi:hypothetical protein